MLSDTGERSAVLHEGSGAEIDGRASFEWGKTASGQNEVNIGL